MLQKNDKFKMNSSKERSNAIIALPTGAGSSIARASSFLVCYSVAIFPINQSTGKINLLKIWDKKFPIVKYFHGNYRIQSSSTDKILLHKLSSKPLHTQFWKQSDIRDWCVDTVGALQNEFDGPRGNIFRCLCKAHSFRGKQPLFLLGSFGWGSN